MVRATFDNGRPGRRKFCAGSFQLAVIAGHDGAMEDILGRNTHAPAQHPLDQ